MIQESLVAVLGEIHHWAIIHSNSFWARNEKCLKPRGLQQNFNRQLLSPAEEERGGFCCSAGLPGEKGTERWELPLESCTLRWGESPPAPAPPCCGHGQLCRSSRCQHYLVTVRILFHIHAFNLLNGLIVLPSRGVDTTRPVSCLPQQRGCALLPPRVGPGDVRCSAGARGARREYVGVHPCADTHTQVWSRWKQQLWKTLQMCVVLASSTK